MGLLNVLDNVRLIFLDSAPVIYYVEHHPRYYNTVRVVFDRLDADELAVITSPITLAECLIIPYRLKSVQLQKDFSDVIVNGANTIFTSLDTAIALQAAQLRAQYNLTLLDSFQLATAIQTRCEAFLTNDMSLKRVTEMNVVVVEDFVG